MIPQIRIAEGHQLCWRQPPVMVHGKVSWQTAPYHKHQNRITPRLLRPYSPKLDRAAR